MMACKAALGALLLAVLVATAAAADDQAEGGAASAALISGWYSGAATFYGGPQDSEALEYDTKISTGSCGYGDIDPKLWPFYLVAGLSPNNPILSGLRQRGCGSCLELSCTGAGCHPGVPPVQAMITDECAQGCNDTQVNLHVFGFEMLAATDLGRVDIRYRLVACEPVDPITIHVDAYRVTEGGWLRLALKDVAGEGQITAVELAPAAATDLNQSSTYADLRAARGSRATRPAARLWRRANNTYGAAWELSGVPPPPLHMRITNGRAQTIIITNAIPRAGILGDIDTNAQLPPPPPPGAGAAPPLALPPGSYLAPGATNVLVFPGPEPEPAPAAAGKAAAPGNASDAGAGADGEGEGGSYAVAGFLDEDSDGIADADHGVVGMPDASSSAANAAAPAAAPAAGPAPAAAPVPRYAPAPADAGGPEARRRVLARRGGRRLMLE
ncbi:MAG: RlpA-like double-psi beta-barrel-protein domain-containing protein-containing protein [Monoraphidium minutum]|nr:MAG: RlpA-like double-psi beta-barrel-protein domain-containing protein-containing protein [Monoraphidium minutum]